MYLVEKKFMTIKIHTLLFVLLFSFSITSTAQQKVKYFHYTSITDPSTDSNLIPLEKGESPQVIMWKTSEEYTKLLKDFKDKGYTLIGTYFGHPSFKDSKNKKRALTAAKKARATVVVANSFVFTTFYVLQKEIPKTPVVVEKVVSGSTTTNVVITNTGKSSKLGVSLRDLTLVERTDIERNKGAFIIDVFDDTPAFDSNIIPGDILIKISNFQVKDAAQALILIKAVDTDEDLILTVFRKGNLKEITVKF